MNRDFTHGKVAWGNESEALTESSSSCCSGRLAAESGGPGLREPRDRGDPAVWDSTAGGQPDHLPLQGKGTDCSGQCAVYKTTRITSGCINRYDKLKGIKEESGASDHSRLSFLPLLLERTLVHERERFVALLQRMHCFLSFKQMRALNGLSREEAVQSSFVVQGNILSGWHI